MKYLQIHLANARQYLIFPARNVIWILSDITFYLAVPFVWLYIISKQGPISGYNASDIVTYYIIAAAASSIGTSDASWTIVTHIIEGRLSNYLILPAKYFNIITIREYVSRLISGAIVLMIFIIAHALFPAYVILPRTSQNFLFFIFAIIIAFAISHTMQIIAGMLGFWFGRNRIINSTIWLSTSMLSGGIAPLAFYPGWIRTFAEHSPFFYLTYFPVSVYLGKISTENFAIDTLVALMWLAAFSFIIFVLWTKGLKKYDGAGI